MSFILDALKKSESERQRQAGPALLEMRIVRPARQLPVWVMVVGAVLIISVGALAWLVLRPSSAPASAAISPAAPAAAAASSAQPAAYASAAAGTASNVQGPPAVAPLPVSAAAAPALTQPQPAAAADGNPADSEPAVAPPAGSAHDYSRANNLRTYAELGGSLPELRLDLHVYASNPAERYAFINMHKMREGDVTPEGVQVKEITRDGVVLDYRGTEFILGHQ
jgi:general secretion pathway protein B